MTIARRSPRGSVDTGAAGAGASLTPSPGGPQTRADHVAHCVDHAIASGDREEQRKKIAELMDVVSRADR